jgi:hypothetical protein
MGSLAMRRRDAAGGSGVAAWAAAGVGVLHGYYPQARNPDSRLRRGGIGRAAAGMDGISLCCSRTGFFTQIAVMLGFCRLLGNAKVAAAALGGARAAVLQRRRRI